MQILTNFVDDTFMIFAVALAIALVAFLAYYFWFGPAYQSTFQAIRAMNATLLDQPSDWQSMNERAHRVLDVFPQLRSSWLETQQRVIEVDDKGDKKLNIQARMGLYARVVEVGDKGVKKAVMFGSPRDLWNPSALLSHRFNLGLADAVPNILVGVGLFFTFLFLTIALLQATTALGSDKGFDASRDAVTHLLSAAGGKFMTSLAGLLSSLVWTGFAKREFKVLSLACYELLDTLAIRIPTIGAELLMQKQAQSLADEVNLSEELLIELREQTSTFKRYGTDLAVALAGINDKAFTPQIEAVTDKLVDSIEGMSEKLSSINQRAMQQMLADFSVMLQKTSKAEMAQLQSTLSALTDKFNAVSVAIEAERNQFRSNLDEASSNERVAAVLKASGQPTKDSIESADTALSQTESTITAGVADYSNQVAEIQRHMDGGLAKTVGSFQMDSSELSDSVEEWAGILQSRKA